MWAKRSPASVGLGREIAPHRRPAPSDRPVTSCGHGLKPPRHSCRFFDSREQQYAARLPYFAEGLTNGERVLTVMDRDVMEDHNQRLAATGLPQGGAGMCTLCSEDTYLAGGAFSKDRMCQMVERELTEMQRLGFSGIRTCEDMQWALRNMSGTDELLAYESDVNELLSRYDATFLCVYDASRISARMMLDVLSTHSHVVIGDAVHGNPY